MRKANKGTNFFLCKMFAYTRLEKISQTLTISDFRGYRKIKYLCSFLLSLSDSPYFLWILDVNIQQITDAKQGAQNTLRKYQKSFSLLFYDSTFRSRIQMEDRLLFLLHTHSTNGSKRTFLR